MHDGVGREASLTHLGYGLIGYRLIPFALITVAFPAQASNRWDVRLATLRAIQCGRAGQALTFPDSLCRRFGTYSSSSSFLDVIMLDRNIP